MIKISIVMGYRLRQNKNIFRKKHTESYIRLINSLDSLRKQTFSKDEYEIILVDYGSTVPIKNYIKTLYPFVKVIYTDEKESFNEYKAKNIGIKPSKGKFFLSSLNNVSINDFQNG